MCFFICVVSHRDEKSAAAQNEGERHHASSSPRRRVLPTAASRAGILFYALRKSVKPFDDFDANKTERESFSKSIGKKEEDSRERCRIIIMTHPFVVVVKSSPVSSRSGRWQRLKVLRTEEEEEEERQSRLF